FSGRNAPQRSARTASISSLTMPLQFCRENNRRTSNAIQTAKLAELRRVANYLVVLGFGLWDRGARRSTRRIVGFAVHHNSRIMRRYRSSTNPDSGQGPLIPAIAYFEVRQQSTI